jgi:glutamyl-tRNA reductase
MKTFDELSPSEQQEFLKFPVYIALLAANADGDTIEKQTAIDFDHMKRYTCNPLLSGFYEKADKVFEQNLDQLDDELPKGKMEREVAIKVELRKIKELLHKFDKEYAIVMHESMQSLKEHVSSAHHNILEDFLFPIPIRGLTY